MDSLQQQLEAFSINLDNFPVGAASVQNSLYPESEVHKLQSTLHCTNADILFLQTLIDIAKNYNAVRGRADDTHIAKYDNNLANFMSVIRHPRNMADVADEAQTLEEALKMQPEEMELHSSLGSILALIHKILPMCSSSQLELLEIQNDINQKIEEIQVMEGALMEKKCKYAKNLSKQKKELNKKKNSKDSGYHRKNEELKSLARDINKLKMIIQSLIQISPDAISRHNQLIDILVYTRKPVNLVAYSTQL